MVTSPSKPPALHPVLAQVTRRIVERSAPLRSAYLARIDRLVQRPPGPSRMGCANVAHAFAALPANDKLRVVVEKAPHLGVVTSFNDMLSAHQPYEGYPAVVRDEAHRLGATTQVAGGVPRLTRERMRSARCQPCTSALRCSAASNSGRQISDA